MPEGYFSGQRDNELITAGGFFCQGCLIGKPVGEQSQDARYCQGCYEFLLAEGETIKSDGRPGSWYPHRNKVIATPGKVSVVLKLADKEIPLLPVMKHPGGRPVKTGEVSRTTRWRRNKQGQGIL